MKINPVLIFCIILGIMLILLSGFSALPVISPQAVLADAPATRFSAGRAMNDLQVVASEPHGAGSVAQERVRGYILSQVASLGLNAEVQTSGKISNILVRLPGIDPTLTVLITGHYDTNSATPGAGDDGLSTVAMLETMRVLYSNPPLRNDVLFLFTDGEELGWLGAKAFLNRNPQAKNEIGLVLCFDGRPGNGPLTLRQTSPGDAWLARELSRAALPIWAGSWKNPSERTDQDTDFEIFQMAGFTGVEIENEAAGTAYHTNRDTVDAISPRLVQSFGQAMLALANHFGNIDLLDRTGGPDVTFFSLPLVGIVDYPAWVMPVLSVVGVLALLAMVIIAWRKLLISLGRFLLGALGILGGIVLVVLFSQLAWGVILKAHGVASSSAFDQSASWIAGLLVVAAILMIALLSFLSRRLGEINLSVAAVVIYLLLGISLYLLIDGDNPFTAAYLAWPFLGAVMGIGVLLFTKNPVWKAVLLSIAALFVLALMVPTLILGTYTPEGAWITVLVLNAWIGLLAPQLGAIFGRTRSSLVQTNGYDR
jgi:hypothetical protein